MTQAEKEAFLAGVHIGVVGLADGERGPLTVPVWYDYRPGGEVWFVTGADSRKARLLAAGTRMSLCAQTETVPYRYVSVEGVVAAVEAADRERHTRPMAIRYLGEATGNRYADASDGDSILVRMRPERWLAVDYGKS